MILELSLLFYCTQFVIGGCGQTLFTSPQDSFIFSSNSADKSCVYKIRPEQRERGYYTVLKFQYFSFNGHMPDCEGADSITVYTGCGRRNVVSTFCSDSITPHDIYARDGCIDVSVNIFNINKDYRERLLQVRYETFPGDYDEFGTCSGHKEFTLPSGVIGTPGWPEHYLVKNFGSRQCSWFVERTDDQVVQINVMDFSLATESQSASPCQTGNDAVEIKGWIASNDRPASRSYCFSKMPFSRSTSYYKFEVKMTLVETWFRYNKARGFVLGYVFYSKNPEILGQQDKGFELSIGGVITIAAVVVIVAVVVIFILKTVRRRRIEEQYYNENYAVHYPCDSEHRNNQESRSQQANRNLSAGDNQHQRDSLVELQTVDYDEEELSESLQPSYNAPDDLPPSYNDVISSRTVPPPSDLHPPSYEQVVNQ